MKIRIYPKSLLETIWQQDILLFTPEAKQPPLCLRCGQPLDRRLVINALTAMQMSISARRAVWMKPCVMPTVARSPNRMGSCQKRFEPAADRF